VPLEKSIRDGFRSAPHARFRLYYMQVCHGSGPRHLVVQALVFLLV
jgi:hypothetical protein